MSAKCQKRTWASFSPEWKTCSGERMRTLFTSIEAHQPDLLGKLGAVSDEQAKAIRRLTTKLQGHLQRLRLRCQGSGAHANTAEATNMITYPMVTAWHGRSGLGAG